MAPRYSQKRFSIWRLSAILNLQNFDFVCQKSSSECQSASVYQISSKSANSQLRYEVDAIIKMAAVRHRRRSKFRVDQPIWRRDIAEKQFSIWRLSAMLDFLWRNHIAPENCILRSQLCVKFSGRLRNFWNILYFIFQHFGLKLPISDLI